MPKRLPINLSAWNEWTAEYMYEHGITQSDLSRRMHIMPGSVHTRLAGISPPPIGRTLIAWMDALRLTDAECRHFRRLAYLGNCPDEVRIYFARLTSDDLGAPFS